LIAVFDISQGKSYFKAFISSSLIPHAGWRGIRTKKIKETDVMQRHKSVEKRVRSSKKANLINKMGRSRIATSSKKALEATDPAKAQEALRKAISILDKSVKTGLIHKNKAANRKSKLTKAINKIAAK
jgi:small subunit ribosomal protein S20